MAKIRDEDINIVKLNSPLVNNVEDVLEICDQYEKLGEKLNSIKQA